jgi:sensor histidine kinase YesM
MPEKGQLQYGIEKVKSNIGVATSVAVLDVLIRGAVRQVLRIFNTIGAVLSIIPGASFIIRIFNLIIETACNYIDECILGYIFVNKRNNPELNTWKASADGIVLYAQNWKAIGVGAVKTVLMLWVLKVVLFIVAAVLFTSSLNMGFFGILFIGLIVWSLNKSLIDPLATVSMAKAYFAAVEQNPVPTVDLYEKVTNSSSKFRKILENAGSSSDNMAQPTNI